ncbi:carboxy-terminal crystallin fold protein 10p, putative (macronuclear) [Tetrahymena thermophila SB210]|uniref:Carboxy-terminal crystallin fold protein 10p, putative n=1 Tax=Tetrahymena thermophila (strain SB210) TaxID=312017 RepID=I7M275_TETTS|nr:carboxy-terminal crystallin fold protein 10p, putative [Tetrahymena thermophila SB210]EAR99470.1 carboxy-terminal crystallin fold protein 10p, putative [Tetrahymena thermophila SB210]|eukprot:XP_001019715.1 carboxy-terminal crystallin fold protein 10p, putative [Tetrahymena thermophila SB210]
MKKLLFLTLILISISRAALPCNSSCQCDPGSNVCLRCELDFIGSQIDQYQRSCPCPENYYRTPYVDCEYIYTDSQYSPGCAENCRDYATLEEAKVACNLDPSCQAITWSFAGVGGSASTNPIGNGHGYQLRASNFGALFLPNKENTWVKGSCPANNNVNANYDGQCDFQGQQGATLNGCVQDCKDFATLQDAENACRADPNCGGVTFSRAELGGSASTNAYNGVYGFQLRAGRHFDYSQNGENSWKKQICNGCSYGYANGEYSGGCVQGCQDFATLDEAKVACNADPSCKAVTWSFAAVGGPNASNASGNGHGYQLRASSSGSIFKPNQENSWIKDQCPDPQLPDNPCDFEAYQGSQILGCDQNCIDFSNLNDALNACRADPNCGGVTFSRSSLGGSASTNAYDGVWGYQLRSGNVLVQSQNGENSWLKVNCPYNFFNCAHLLTGASQLDACQISIAEQMSAIIVDTLCYFDTENDQSFVNSIVTLDLTQTVLPVCCYPEIITKVQYENPNTSIYEDLPSQYVTAGANGQQSIKIPLIDIYNLAYSTTVGPSQISQVVYLQILIGTSLSFDRIHKWCLYVYTERNETHTFQIDVDKQTTQNCTVGNCVIIADLSVTGQIYTDNTYTTIQDPSHSYVIGDIFYAKISFLDPTYTKKLDFVSLYLKDARNIVYDYTSLTTANWDGTGLRIALQLIDPSLEDVIQINMVIDASRFRFLSGTDQSSANQNQVSRQFTVQVLSQPQTTPKDQTTTQKAFSSIFVLASCLIYFILLF